MYISHESGSVSHSVMSVSAALWTVAHQAPLSMEFSRQECWSGLPFPFPGDLPDPGIKLRSPCIADRLFTIWVTKGAHISHEWFLKVDIQFTFLMVFFPLSKSHLFHLCSLSLSFVVQLMFKVSWDNLFWYVYHHFSAAHTCMDRSLNQSNDGLWVLCLSSQSDYELLEGSTRLSVILFPFLWPRGVVSTRWR